jgi:hypothetical protein
MLALVVAGGCTAKPSAPPKLGAITIRCRMPIAKGPKVPCELAVRDHAGSVLYDDHAGVDVLEGSSSAFLKPSYGIELRDFAATTLSANLFGMGGESDWALDGFEADRSLMRSALVYDSFRAIGAGRDSPDGHYVTLTLNGVAQGIYRLVETIKRDDDRLAISTDDGSGRTFIAKLSTSPRPEFPVALGVPWEFVYPNDTNVTPQQRDAFAAWLVVTENAVVARDAATLFAQVDRDALADWILLQELAKNIDAYTHDVHLVRDNGGRARVVPWDFDLSLGQPTVTGDTTIPGNDGPEGWISNRPQLIQQLAAVPELVTRMVERWRALRRGPWSDAAIARRLDGYAVTLDPATVASNFEIWDAAAHDVSVFDAGAPDGDVADADVPDGDVADAGDSGGAADATAQPAYTY